MDERRVNAMLPPGEWALPPWSPHTICPELLPYGVRERGYLQTVRFPPRECISKPTPTRGSTAGHRVSNARSKIEASARRDRTAEPSEENRWARKPGLKSQARPR